MLGNAAISLHRALILVVIAVALTATGFAHRMPSTQDETLLFALANGAGASDFCGSLPGRDGTASVDCPACQIAAGADVPPPVDLCVHLAGPVGGQAASSRDAAAVRSVRDPAHGPQGPPVA